MVTVIGVLQKEVRKKIYYKERIFLFPYNINYFLKIPDKGLILLGSYPVVVYLKDGKVRGYTKEVWEGGEK